MSDFKIGDRVVARSDLPESNPYRHWHEHFNGVTGTVCELPERYKATTRDDMVALRWDGIDYNLAHSPGNCHTVTEESITHEVTEEDVQAAIESILRGSN